MAILFATILYDFLIVPLFRIFLILIAVCVVIAIVYFCLPSTNIERDKKWITKEWKLLTSLQEDVENVLQSGYQTDCEAHKLWQTEESNQGRTARLQDSEETWMEKIKGLSREAADLLENSDNSAVSVPGERIRRFKLEIGNLLKEKIEKSIDIFGTLERLRSKIRNLQVRPIDDEQKADVHKLDEKLIVAVHEAENIDEVVAAQKKEKLITAPLIGEIESFKLHLALFRAFLTDLQRFGVETSTEKIWLEQAKEIVGEVPLAIKNSELMEEMKRINAEFSDLLERKKRFGFRFTRSFIRRDQSKSVSETSQQQASKEQTSDDDMDIVCDVKKLNEKYRLQLSNEKLTQLCEKFKEVYRSFEEAKTKEGINSSTEERSKQMKILADKTEKCLKEYKEKLAKESWSDTFWKSGQTDFDKKIEQIKNGLDLLVRTMEAYSIEIKEETGVVGLDEDIQAVVSDLISENKHVVCIVGMKGTGKTTLAKKIFDHSAVVGHFTARDWVTPTDQKAKQVWINKVCDILKKEKYLAVLDDFTAENEDAWETLKAAFRETDGSRILLTPHDQCVARTVGQPSKLHYLRLRTKEESWRLFIQMVDDFGSAADNVKKLAEETVGRCVGLPLQILHFGYLMSGKDKKDPNLLEWLQHIHPDQKQWLAYLKIGSSNFLEDWLLSQGIYFEDWHENLRKIYAFFNLFPRDYEIPTRRLVALSVAEELVEEGRDKNKSPKPVAMDYLSILIGLNLIQAVEMNINGKVTKCRLPNALRDHKFFQSSISDENLAVSQKNKIKDEHLADHYDRNSDSFNDIHFPGINSPNFQKRYKDLVSYLSFDTGEGYKPGEDIKNFLQKGIANGCFRSLKVLDLEHVFRPQLPSIGQLVQLMYLGLRWTYLEEIPSSVGNLLNLQTLDVKHTYVRTLPKSIWKLHKLRHLYLNQSHRSKFVTQPRSSSLKNLQTLWGLFVDDFSAIKNGLNKLNKLTKLGLAFRLESQEQKNALVKWVKGLIYLKSLRLRSVGEKGEALDLYLENISKLNNLSSLYLFGKLEDQSIKSLFPNADSFCLSDLTLSASGLKEDPMPTLGSLPKLKSLSFHLGSFKGKEMVCLGKGFPELLVLKLWKLESLEELQVEEESMQKLRELDIRCCNKLKVPTGFKHLKSLQELKLTNMPENFTTTIEKKKWQIWDDTAHPPRITKDNW